MNSVFLLTPSAEKQRRPRETALLLSAELGRVMH
jgi:hypothetical protein